MSVSDLLQLFCNREDTRTKQISTACSDSFVQNNGKDLVFLFDGFDEYPEVLQKNGLIADMLKRKVLPDCTLVVSSHPHATVYLREQATVRVDILGFTKVEQNQFIQQALKEQPQSIKKVAQYLENHYTISSLCVVPFHMVILLFLYKQGISLPNNSAELYNYFICLTICRHLAKHGHVLNNTITSSHKEWNKLNLYGCYIQDRGVHILHHGLTSCEDVTITKLCLNSNSLTEFSSTAISDITINCRVKELRISDNSTIGKDEWLSSVISDPSSMLEVLHMYSTKLSSNVAVKIFTALSKHNTLRILRIHNNDITDEACDAIVMAMKKNTSLVELRMDGNPISGECAQLIVEAIKHNNTLQLLSLPFNYLHYVKEKIGLSVEEIN